MALISKLFGDEARGIYGLLGTDLARDALREVRNEANYGGSALKEYEVRSQTTANRVKLFNNEVTELSRTFGDILKPELDELMAKLTPIIRRVTRMDEGQPGVGGDHQQGVRGPGRLPSRDARRHVRDAQLARRSPYRAEADHHAEWGLLGRGVLPALLSRMRLVTRALVALRGALLFSGVGAILLAIAGAGEFIRDNWTGLGTFFREFGASLETALGAETSAKIQPLLSALKELGAWMTSGSWKIDDATWRDGARRLVRTSRPR